MSEVKKPWFEDSKQLESACDFLLNSLPEEFKDVFQSKFKIFFTNKDPSQRHFAGYCRKLDKAMQHRTGLHFIIVIFKPFWQDTQDSERYKVLIHELHHILVEEKESDDEDEEPKLIYKLRKHNEREDFCELPSHDKYSEAILNKLAIRASPKDLGRSPLVL